jgi:DNA helicase II / ATP-dependent DNA helicase PcrA
LDKTVIFAVAGSGKTRKIIDNLNDKKRTLIITYTNANYENIRIRILDKFGYWPKNITLETYFVFLYGFCSQPYIQNALKLNGLIFSQQAEKYTQKNVPKHYFNQQNKVYSNRLAKLLIETELTEKINARLEKYYECVCIDEVQDFAANDFNFLVMIFKSNVSFLCVGDFYQHTFDTGSDGQTNINLHKNFDSYKKRFTKAGLLVDTTTLSESFRCPEEVCNFVSDNLDISISSNKKTKGSVKILNDVGSFEPIYKDDNVVKLFWDSSYKYQCFSNNWGKSKGIDSYEDVCVILTRTASSAYQKGELAKMSDLSKSKLYVACTRTNRNLYLVPDNIFKKFYKKNIQL